MRLARSAVKREAFSWNMLKQTQPFHLGAIVTQEAVADIGAIAQIGHHDALRQRYRDAGQFKTATSRTRKLTVSGNIVTVSFKKVTIKNGKVTVNGVIGHPPATSGGKLALFAQKAGSSRFTRIGKASIGKGKTMTVSAYTINDGNNGLNYTVTTVVNKNGAITDADGEQIYP